MASQDFPLLLLSKGVPGQRDDLNGRGPPPPHTPDAARQGVRLTPKFQRLEQALEAKRFRIQSGAPLHDSDFVLILEIAGEQADFFKAVGRLPLLDWHFETDAEFSPDDDFYQSDAAPGSGDAVSGKMFMVGTNQAALAQVLSYWRRYQTNPEAPFERGLAPLKHVFEQLIDVRYWDVQDRIDDEMFSWWSDELESGRETIRFELEAWHYRSPEKNERTALEIRQFATAIGGRIIRSALISQISYHGFLVEIPATAVQSILEGNYPDIVLSDRVMFFRPRAQSISDSPLEPKVADQQYTISVSSTDAPVVALLDGLPLSNHSLLQGRLIIDDPDGWEAAYEAKDRVHGTAMASLILYGDLGTKSAPSSRSIYVRPIMRPNLTAFGHRRPEETPDTELLIDLIHRAVRRIFEADGQEPPVAPTVRIINLSVGNCHRIFSREISPWARLIDWLSLKYGVLFVISCGNELSELTLPIRRDSLSSMSLADQQAAALKALFATGNHRRLMSPAEAINALSIGALHTDESTLPAVPSRFDLYAAAGISPISRTGLGVRRAIKPDILMPGGRLLYSQHMLCPPDKTVLQQVALSHAPGQLAARPPSAGGGLGEAEYSRGTSNATAMASRFAAKAYDVLASIRASGSEIPTKYDAVLLKALVVHGADWGDLPNSVLSHGPACVHPHASSRAQQERDLIASWIGYGAVNEDRALTCASNRATLLGFGEVSKDCALEFSAPVPPGLGGKVVARRMVVTLAWMSPINSSSLKYRQAKLWIDPPDEFATKRQNMPDHKTVRRGTVQHEVWEGTGRAVPLVEGGIFKCRINCSEDAPSLNGNVPFALCISIEVPVEAGIDVYGEIRDRLRPRVQPGIA